MKPIHTRYGGGRWEEEGVGERGRERRRKRGGGIRAREARA